MLFLDEILQLLLFIFFSFSPRLFFHTRLANWEHDAIIGSEIDQDKLKYRTNEWRILLLQQKKSIDDGVR